MYSISFLKCTDFKVKIQYISYCLLQSRHLTSHTMPFMNFNDNSSKLSVAVVSRKVPKSVFKWLFVGDHLQPGKEKNASRFVNVFLPQGLSTL